MRYVLAALVVFAGTARAQPVDAPPPDAPPEPAPEPAPDAQPVDVVEPAPVDEDEDKDKGKDEGKDQDPKKKKKKKNKKDSEYSPEISGYLQVLAQRPFDTNDSGDRGNSTFRVQRVRLKLDGKIMPKLGYSISISPVEELVTDVLRDAYLWSKHIPFHELRVGQQKTQFGYENNESSSKLYYVRRAHVSSQLARGPTSRDIGIGIVGEIPLGGGLSIEDGFTAVNGSGHNVATDTTRKKAYWGRLGGRYENKPLDIDLRLGVSGAIGDGFDAGADPEDPLDDFRFDFTRLGVDVQADHKWGFVAAEYVTGTNTDQETDVDYDAKGYYVVVAAKTPWKVGPVIRYDAYDVELTEGTEYKRWTFGGYYGTRAATLRAMINYEHRPDRDDRLILWSQAKF